MKNKNVSVIFKTLPVMLLIAGGFLFNVNAESPAENINDIQTSRINGSINITSSAKKNLNTYTSEDCGGGYICNQLQGFTVTNDALVFYNASGVSTYGKGSLRGYTGTDTTFDTKISGTPFIREYNHGNDMTYKPSTNEIFVSEGGKPIHILNGSDLAEKSTFRVPGIVSIGYDEVDDKFILTQNNGNDEYYFTFFTLINNSFTKIDIPTIHEEFGSHPGGSETLNVGQGMEYYKGYIYQTEDNWDSSLSSDCASNPYTTCEVGYINVYKAKLKSDGTTDNDYGKKVATYYINALELGEIESISFRNGRAYLGFAHADYGENNTGITRFTNFNASVIEQGFSQPTYSFIDNANSTSIVVTSTDTQLADKNGWVLSEDGYTLTKTKNENTISGTNTSICDRYGNCTSITYDHTNENFGKEFTLTFDSNGGEGTVAAQTCFAPNGSCEVTIPSTKPTKTGYRLLGWGDKATNTTASMKAGDKVTLTANKTVYAIWAPVYKLSFGLNEGTADISSQTCYPSSTNGSCTVTVPTVIPKKDGYYFLGWIRSGDNENIITGGAELSLTESLKLYALWAPIYTVSFDMNGGEGTIDPASCHPNGTSGSCNVELPTIEPTRDGYYFLGWAGTADQDHATKTGTTVAVTGDKVLYAIWAPIYTLTYNLNGGEGTINPASCHPDVINGSCSITISSTQPTRTNYSFLGWANSSSATTAAYQPGGNLSLNANKTIYAVWQENTSTFTLSFNNNGGEGTIPSQSCDGTTSCTVTIPSTKPTKTNYYFLGWTDTDSATTATYQPSSDITLTANKTLYAVWAPIYTLSFDLSGGSGDIESKTCHPNKTSGECDIIIPSAIPTKINYTFLGYGNSASDTSASYSPGGNITLSGNKTLYALWSEDTPTPPDPGPGPEPEPEGTGEISWVQEQTHVKGENKNAVFRIDYPKDKFVSLMIDGITVPTDYYGVESGSTIITINHEYLDTYSVGTHAIVAVFENNVTVSTTFTIEETPVGPDDPDDPDDPEPVNPDDPSGDDEDILVPDTSVVNGNEGGSYGVYLTIASIIVFIAVIVMNIARKIKTNKRIQFKQH